MIKFSKSKLEIEKLSRQIGQAVSKLYGLMLEETDIVERGKDES